MLRSIQLFHVNVEYSKESDVFSFGVCMYEIWSGLQASLFDFFYCLIALTVLFHLFV